MGTKSLTVTYANNTVTVTPTSVNIKKNDNDTLQWSKPQGQTWTFSGIQLKDGSSLPNPPFSNLQITDSQISVTDDNTQTVDRGTWNYQVGINVGGTVIWSDPQIINKGDD
ncbi:MAG: hypothetical protein AB1635_13340 [Acidobacteriota bacterium]